MGIEIRAVLVEVNNIVFVILEITRRRGFWVPIKLIDNKMGYMSFYKLSLRQIFK